MKKYILTILLAIGLYSFTTTKVEGIASYYATRFEGKKTSNGERYRGGLISGACNAFPLGSIVKVKNLKTNKEIFVRINDHIGTDKRIIDLSWAAAKELDIIHKGLTKVSVSLQ